MFKVGLKEKVRENILFVFVCCLVLFVVFAIGSVIYNSKGKIAEISYDEAHYEYTSDTFKYAEWHDGYKEAEEHFKYATKKYNQVVIIRSIFYIGSVLFLVLLGLIVTMFFKEIYPRMSNEEKYTFKNNTIRIGLAFIAVVLILSVVLCIFSVDKLEEYKEALEVSRVLDGYDDIDNHYEIKELKAQCNKYELYRVISIIGICLSGVILLGYALLIGFNFMKQKNAVNANSTDVYDELIKLKKLLDEGIITQEEFDNKKANSLKEL